MPDFWALEKLSKMPVMNGLQNIMRGPKIGQIKVTDLDSLSFQETEKNKYLKKPAQHNIAMVKRCFVAYERFVMTGAIALGLLQLVSLKFEQSVWNRFTGFLRTKSRKLPSERTVKRVIEKLLVIDLISFAPAAVMREIRKQCFKDQPAFQKEYWPTEPEEAVFEAEETV